MFDVPTDAHGNVIRTGLDHVNRIVTDTLRRRQSRFRLVTVFGESYFTDGWWRSETIPRQGIPRGVNAWMDIFDELSATTGAFYPITLVDAGATNFTSRKQFKRIMP